MVFWVLVVFRVLGCFGVLGFRVMGVLGVLRFFVVLGFWGF